MFKLMQYRFFLGSNKYDYKGCWRDFDMSAFAIPLLEGTDPILTGAYKKREDPVNDCATISQHRGYSGTDHKQFFTV